MESYSLATAVQLGWIASGDRSFKPTRQVSEVVTSAGRRLSQSSRGHPSHLLFRRRKEPRYSETVEG